MVQVLCLAQMSGMRGVGGVYEMCMCLARTAWVDRGVIG